MKYVKMVMREFAIAAVMMLAFSALFIIGSLLLNGYVKWK